MWLNKDSNFQQCSITVKWKKKEKSRDSCNYSHGQGGGVSGLGCLMHFIPRETEAQRGDMAYGRTPGRLLVEHLRNHKSVCLWGLLWKPAFLWSLPSDTRVVTSSLTSSRYSSPNYKDAFCYNWTPLRQSTFLPWTRHMVQFAEICHQLANWCLRSDGQAFISPFLPVQGYKVFSLSPTPSEKVFPAHFILSCACLNSGNHGPASY